MKPKLSWNPIRYINSMLEEGTPTLEEWIGQAPQFNLEHLELYGPLLKSREPSYLESVRQELENNGVTLSQLTCAPDFTHPDADERQRQFDDMVENIEVARLLGAPAIRVTTGCAHPEVERSVGVDWCVAGVKRLLEHSEPKGIFLALENHYKDRRWTQPDFAFYGEVFLEIWGKLEGTAIRANFDASNQIMVNEDPLTILHAVKDKMVHMHANDRVPGSYQHTVVGEGNVDWDAIFTVLKESNYTGCIALEDGTGEGDAGTERSLAFLREKIDEYYS